MGGMMMDDSNETANASGLTVQIERMRMKKKGSGPSQPQKLFTAGEEEMMNSLQRNQMLAKQQKQMQRKARKQQQFIGQEEGNQDTYGSSFMGEDDEPMAMMTNNNINNDLQLPDDEDEDL